jgi:hypothetical protein
MKFLFKNVASIYKLTNEACHAHCKDNFNCCDKIFCNETEQQALILGIEKIPDRNSEGMFIFDNRCIIEAKFRPFCSSFICPNIKEKLPRNLRREYKHLREKIEDKLIPILKEEKNKGHYNPSIIPGRVGY